MSVKIKIGSKTISEVSECFVIAEIGQNHQGDIEIAKNLIEMAKFCGVDAVKLQKRHNRTLYTRNFFDTPYNSENAFAPTYGLHRQALEFSKREYKTLKRHAEKLGLVFFATAWDFKSADFLFDIGVTCFKIASADIINIPLLKYVAKYKLPMIVSTGTATIEDVKRAHDAIFKHNKNLVLMQCTAIYPARAHQLDLRVIESYKKLFPDTIIGFSNHFNGISVDPVAFTLGARVIEKHFTLDRSMKGADHAFSLEPIGMRKLVRDLHRIKEALGDGVKKLYQEEMEARKKMGKCIVAAKNLAAGHALTEADLAYKSPFSGVEPYKASDFLGKALKTALKRDQALEYAHVQAS